MTIDKIVVKRTLLDNSTVTDTTNVTISSSSGPFNLAVGAYTVDPISVQVDGNHDTYVMFFMDGASVNPNIGNTGDCWISNIMNGTFGNSARKSFLDTGFKAGDQTGSSVMPPAASTALLYPVIDQIVTV